MKPTRNFIKVTTALLALTLAAAHANAESQTVNSIAALQSAINSAKPGDTITVKNGTYKTTDAITITRAGKDKQPIIIAAETVGGVEIAGAQGFAFKPGAAHIVISGFKFTHASGKTNIAVGAHHIRITRNTFQCVGTGPYLGVSGDDCEIDHNEFRDKKTLGNMISLAGEKGRVARRAWIHHNYFHDFANAKGNGAETIRYGLSHLSMSNGEGIIEYNLFVRCVGENELISNKSCANTYRHNTFIDSPRAQLTLRHGNDCVVEKNYFRNTDGLRIFGDRQKIEGNYFEQNSCGINIGNGGAEIGDGIPGVKLTEHDRPDDCVIRKNILIDNKVQYLMGGRQNGLGATNTTFADNVIVGGETAAKIDGPNTGAVWKNNIAWKVGSLGKLPESSTRQTDPGKLTPEAAGIKILTPADVGPAAP